MGQFRGELAALTAAMLWAIASVVYARVGKTLSPLVLNLVKGLVAIALLLGTALALQRPFPEVEFQSIGFLALSGVVGIGLGDTFFFRSLTLLGPRRALLLESLAPPLSALLALIFLQEVLAIANVFGIFLTVGGVTWAVSERLPPENSALENSAPEDSASEDSASETLISKNLVSSPSPKPQNLLLGIGYGLLAAIGQASGAVLSRAALADTTMDPLWSSLIRLGAGAVLLSLWLVISGRSLAPRSLGEAGSLPRPRLSWRTLGVVAIAAFLGTYLAIWLQQVSLKFAPAGIAQALTSTSQLFVMPLAVWMGDRLSLRAILGVAIALAGIVLLFR